MFDPKVISSALIWYRPYVITCSGYLEIILRVLKLWLAHYVLSGQLLRIM